MLHRIEPHASGFGATLHTGDGGHFDLVVEPVSGAREAPTLLDGLAVGLLPLALKRGGLLRIEAPVTRDMVRNLVELADAWHEWRPNAFQRIDVDAEPVVDLPIRPRDPAGMFAWSGSLRSTHTLVRHLDALVPGAVHPASVLRIHGLHPCEAEPWTDGRGEIPAQGALAAHGVATVAFRTNARATGLIDDQIGVMPIVAAAMHLANPDGGTALHAREWPFAAQLRFPRPGPALPDLYSGGATLVRADGGTTPLPDMARDLARHPELLAAISGCRRIGPSAPPCGRCRECTLAALAFQAAGLPGRGRRARWVSVATLPFGDPGTAVDAIALQRLWQARRSLTSVTLWCKRRWDALAIAVRDVARWIGAMTRLRPIWPR